MFFQVRSTFNNYLANASYLKKLDLLNGHQFLSSPSTTDSPSFCPCSPRWRWEGPLLGSSIGQLSTFPFSLSLVFVGTPHTLSKSIFNRNRSFIISKRINPPPQHFKIISGSSNSLGAWKVKKCQAQYALSNDPSFTAQCIIVLPYSSEKT